jgi:hypothetical protein
MGVKTCLVEPTDWPGYFLLSCFLLSVRNLNRKKKKNSQNSGQMTASGVSAIDFAWHKVVDNKTGFVLNVAAIARNEKNIPTLFFKLLHSLPKLGNCWVSQFCYIPEDLLNLTLLPELDRLQQSGALKIFFNSVPKFVQKNAKRIESLTIVTRPAPTSDE